MKTLDRSFALLAVKFYGESLCACGFCFKTVFNGSGSGHTVFFLFSYFFQQPVKRYFPLVSRYIVRLQVNQDRQHVFRLSGQCGLFR